ncbi:DUF2255 family protein [Gramella sp. GC03-9]|uniref:DUF2255 family protein n=1 Tax=Christiangramia oceanisediminis TaxID=2920386 RepID=A0A9X2KZ44_9FLAO|nr:DUF2255 family protein [Gramella oceanisediminis]MCP9200856.1 DUF2255 family protein [Gramella oceanisediminis]
MKFPDNFYEYLESHTMIQIKGGKERLSFLPIWMVQVNGRVFARSWNKSEKSWFTEIERSGVGEIKFGEELLKITGIKVDPSDPIQPDISNAYLQKYDQPHNKMYASGIAASEYFEHTMEFFPENLLNSTSIVKDLKTAE